MAEVTRGLLDTSVWIALDDEEGVLDLPTAASISVATLAELHYGVLIAKTDADRRHRLRRMGLIESSFQPLAIDPAIARAFATVAHAVRLTGRNPRARTMDLWIAATALALNLPLYTRNPDDFVGLEGLVEVRRV